MNHLQVPLVYAEMLHSLLGPLTDALEEEGHHWAPLARRVLNEYVAGRDCHLVDEHGVAVLPAIDNITQAAAEEVCGMVSESLHDAHFDAWGRELAAE